MKVRHSLAGATENDESIFLLFTTCPAKPVSRLTEKSDVASC